MIFEKMGNLMERFKYLKNKRGRCFTLGTLYRTALVLAIIGAVNWGLIGFFQFDLVAAIFGGQDALLSRWVYALVGIAGLVCIPILGKSLDESEAPVTSSNTDTANRAAYRNPSYQTEFAEEDDFSYLDHTDYNENNNNKNSSSNSKSNSKQKK